MMQAAVLRVVLCARAPHKCVVEDVQKLFGNTEACRLDSGALALGAEHHRLGEIRRRALLLGVDPNQAHVVPHLGQQFLCVQVQPDRDDHGVRLASQGVHLLHRDHVDLVVHVHALHVLAVAHQHVDELVSGDVFAQEHFAVVDAVLVQDPPNGFGGVVSKLGKGAGGVELHTSTCLLSKVDVGGPLVQPQPHSLQLPLEDGPVVVDPLLGGVQHHEHQVGRLGHCNHLAPPPLAMGRPLDDPRQIQQLDPRVVVVHVARNTGECSELISCSFRFCVCEMAQQT
mmetsp:Transcript_4798/g.7189  ORF Transcript_4798/g.7189 Transcript_4798/m.7189 type:complete len:284 (-) Transcript_4798:367-1218(-)